MSWTWNVYGDNQVALGTYNKGFAGSANGQFIMAGGSNELGNPSVAVSTDYGVTWNVFPVIGLTGDVTGLACSTSGSIFYVITSNSPTVFYTTDLGETFLDTEAAAFADSNLTCITCDALGENVVVGTAVEGGGDGKLWYNPLPTGVSPGTWVDSGPDGHDWTSVAVNHNGTRYIALASDNGGGTVHGTPGVYYTSDPNAGWTAQSFSGGLSGEKTWKSVSCNNNQSTSRFVACHSGEAGGTAGEVWYNPSTNLGSAWVAISSVARAYNYVTISSNGANVAATAGPAGLYYGTNTSLPEDPDTASPGNGEYRNMAVYLYPSADSPSPGIGIPQVLATESDGMYLSTYGETPVDPICFKEGTKILCLKDGKDTYVPIESMRPGTVVKTYLHGYKKVEHIGFSKAYNPGNGKKSLANFAKCTPAKYPELTDDLVITGAHSILVSTITPKQEEDLRELMGKIYITDDKYRLVACLDDRADPYPDEGTYTIWHFALENEQYTWNYGVYANGLLVETASRRMMKEFSGMTLL